MGRAGSPAVLLGVVADVIPVKAVPSLSEPMRHPAIARGTAEKTAKERAVFVPLRPATRNCVVSQSCLDPLEHLWIDDADVFAFVDLGFVCDLAYVGHVGQ